MDSKKTNAALEPRSVSSISPKVDDPSETLASPITPIFRWAGSKRKILPVLATYWSPSFARYVEPFAGSAALFFRLHPERALLGDINSELIEAYDVIRDRPDDVHCAVSKIARTPREYYRIRDGNTGRLKSFGRAVRFVYLNRYCFNGIFRTNQAGRFNVPFANKKPGVIPPIEHFRRSANLLSRATLKSGDFGALLSKRSTPRLCLFRPSVCRPIAARISRVRSSRIFKARFRSTGRALTKYGRNRGVIRR